MGDFSRCGIHTMFNTGTVAGVGTTLFGQGFLPKFIPSFSWGGTAGLEETRLPALFETNRKAMARRGRTFSKKHEALLKKVFKETAAWRRTNPPPPPDTTG